MGSNVFGRDQYLETLKKYAEDYSVGNQAFLGVKGVGKTSLFQHYFTREKKRQIAGDYKKLFVYSTLDSRKQGSDLQNFLLDQVKIGILGIPDEDDKKEIKDEMKDIDEVFETPDSRLIQYLTVIKERGYDLVLIMDQFHCMARDTEVGSEQYDVLRSLNEQRLITYWIITDTDLRETFATEQFIASFFAQKFTSKLTIRPLDEDCRRETIQYFADQKKSPLNHEETELIAEISGGVPEVMSILIDILVLVRKDGQEVSKEELTRRFLAHDGGTSLFKNWASGLTGRQKELLYDIALSEQGLIEGGSDIDYSKLADLSDDVGRGLLHVAKGGEERCWKINIDLFRQYIENRGQAFYEEPEKEPPADASEAPQPTITNIYNIEGTFIQSQTNNIINIENAVAGLEDLQKLMNRNTFLLDEGDVARKLECLPFKQEAWAELSEQEQEEQLGKYADGVFSSDIFAKGSLTPALMSEFCLSEELLGDLSETCRNNITSGIQVFNLIQLCIDNYGLSMNESESPRGILFVRAFERHLKDNVAPAFLRVPELADHAVYPTQKAFRDYPLDKTTIGTYTGILGDALRTFAEASVQILGYPDKNLGWWTLFLSRLSEIGRLRNNCCHSGTVFAYPDLLNLKKGIFTDAALEDILLFGQMPALRRNQFGTATAGRAGSAPRGRSSAGATPPGQMPRQSTYPIPDVALLGQRVKFKVLEKTTRGSLRGVVNGRYEGSLSKAEAHTLDFNAIKNTEIDVTAVSVQDGKYVLKK